MNPIPMAMVLAVAMPEGSRSLLDAAADCPPQETPMNATPAYDPFPDEPRLPDFERPLTLVTREGAVIADVRLAGRTPDQRLRVAVRLAAAAAAALDERVDLVGEMRGEKRHFPVWPGDVETDLIHRALVEGGASMSETALTCRRSGGPGYPSGAAIVDVPVCDGPLRLERRG